MKKRTQIITLISLLGLSVTSVGIYFGVTNRTTVNQNVQNNNNTNRYSIKNTDTNAQTSQNSEKVAQTTSDSNALVKTSTTTNEITTTSPSDYVTVNNLNYILNTSNRTATVIGTKEQTLTQPFLNIPQRIVYNNQIFQVTGVGNYAFYNLGLLNVILPRTLQTIGVSAFANNLLTSINIPSSVTSIGDLAFRNNNFGLGSKIVLPMNAEWNKNADLAPFDNDGNYTALLSVPRAIIQNQSVYFYNYNANSWMVESHLPSFGITNNSSYEVNAGFNTNRPLEDHSDDVATKKRLEYYKQSAITDTNNINDYAIKFTDNSGHVIGVLSFVDGKLKFNVDKNLIGSQTANYGFEVKLYSTTLNKTVLDLNFNNNQPLSNVLESAFQNSDYTYNYHPGDVLTLNMINSHTQVPLISDNFDESMVANNDYSKLNKLYDLNAGRGYVRDWGISFLLTKVGLRHYTNPFDVNQLNILSKNANLSNFNITGISAPFDTVSTTIDNQVFIASADANGKFSIPVALKNYAVNAQTPITVTSNKLRVSKTMHPTSELMTNSALYFFIKSPGDHPTQINYSLFFSSTNGLYMTTANTVPDFSTTSFNYRNALSAADLNSHPLSANQTITFAIQDQSGKVTTIELNANQTLLQINQLLSQVDLSQPVKFGYKYNENGGWIQMYATNYTSRVPYSTYGQGAADGFNWYDITKDGFKTPTEYFDIASNTWKSYTPEMSKDKVAAFYGTGNTSWRILDGLAVSNINYLGRIQSNEYSSYFNSYSPEVEDEIQTLVNKITNGLNNDYDKAAAIVQWTSQNIKYTMLPGGDDYAHNLQWTFNKLIGICGNYAAISAMLAQHAGLVARVIDGNCFRGVNNWTAFGGINHSWVQIWSQQLGTWLTFDPTWNISGQIGLVQKDFNNNRGDEYVLLVFWPKGTNYFSHFKGHEEQAMYQMNTQFAVLPGWRSAEQKGTPQLQQLINSLHSLNNNNNN